MRYTMLGLDIDSVYRFHAESHCYWPRLVDRPESGGMEIPNDASSAIRLTCSRDWGNV